MIDKIIGGLWLALLMGGFGLILATCSAGANIGQPETELGVLHAGLFFAVVGFLMGALMDW